MTFIAVQLSVYISIAAFVLCQQRHKDKDDAYVDLIALNLIPEGCSSNSYYGYGIVDGSLEKCDKFTEAKAGGEEFSAEYEEIKCRTLRGQFWYQYGWTPPHLSPLFTVSSS